MVVAGEGRERKRRREGTWKRKCFLLVCLDIRRKPKKKM